jgi:hypothetical protein
MRREGAQVFKNYQLGQLGKIHDTLADPNVFQNDPQKASIQLLQANQNLAYANDVMGLILKNISSLQP